MFSWGITEVFVHCTISGGVEAQFAGGLIPRFASLPAGTGCEWLKLDRWIGAAKLPGDAGTCPSQVRKKALVMFRRPVARGIASSFVKADRID